MKPDDINIQVHESVHVMEVIQPEIWLAYSFAPDWFIDASREAKAPLGDVGARRREILFSVAFGESYIVEWVRDEVLKRDYQRFRTYFRAEDKLDAKTKWKEIPKRLCQDKLIPKPLKLGETYWEEWLKLVDYRDGLVHAVSSRPDSASLPETEKPSPPLDVLAKLPPGWAIETTVRLVKELHATVSTPLPSWLVGTLVSG